MADITVEQLKEILHYDPISGLFTWLVDKTGKARVGTTAGTKSHRYIRISIGNRGYPASHLAWLYMTGEWSTQIIDHKDLDRGNNCWENLREASKQQNNVNRDCRKDSLTGHKGVHYRKNRKKYVAYIKADGKIKNIGSFKSAEEAAIAYLDAAKNLHGEFARG